MKPDAADVIKVVLLQTTWQHLIKPFIFVNVDRPISICLHGKRTYIQLSYRQLCFVWLIIINGKMTDFIIINWNNWCLSFWGWTGGGRATLPPPSFIKSIIYTDGICVPLRIVPIEQTSLSTFSPLAMSVHTKSMHPSMAVCFSTLMLYHASHHTGKYYKMSANVIIWLVFRQFFHMICDGKNELHAVYT